jgi:hypothetical protein
LQQRQTDQVQPLRVTIPPRQGARIWQHGNSKQERLARDENLRRIRQVGRKRWKEESGYHRRSLAETTMSRYKRAFGERMHVENGCTPATFPAKPAKPSSTVSRSTAWLHSECRRVMPFEASQLPQPRAFLTDSCNKAIQVA